MSSTLGMHQQRAVLDRIINAQQKVQERLLRTAKLLEAAGVRYAVIGGNAVAAWVATRDESLVRATRDVDLLVDRGDLPLIKEVLEAAGFKFRHVATMDIFLDGQSAKAGDAIHLIYASEPIGASDPVPAPAMEEAVSGSEFMVISLDGLVRTKLVAWRLKDRVHLQDMIGVGLIDSTWPARFQEPLNQRLQSLLDDPDG